MNLVGYIYSRSALAGIMLGLFKRLRLYYPYNLYSMKKVRNSAEGTISYNNMISARDFYNKENDRVMKVKSYLSDDNSRDTYQKIINMRQYYRKEDIPQFNYFNQYFPKKYIHFSNMKDEVFVDCGAFNGDTLRSFISHCPNYKAIVAFEPDSGNVLKLKNNLKKRKNISFIEAGCSDNNGTAFFDCEESSGGSKIVADDTGTKINLVTIDSIPDCKNATFIKMDIEGAEMSALRGGSETIKRNHPKLAICLYHSNEDMIRIPEYIHELVPEYKLYVCAHTMGIAETVLYAIDDNKKNNKRC